MPLLSDLVACQNFNGGPAVETPVGAVAKNTLNCFPGESVAYLWSRCLIMLKKRRCTIAGITVHCSLFP